MKDNNSPLTFGKVLVKNSEAMDRYLNLPKNIQEELLYSALQISSEGEMEALVKSINNL